MKNTNAQHEDAAKTSHLHIRVTPRQKALFVKMAQRHGLKLSAWVTARLENKL